MIGKVRVITLEGLIKWSTNIFLLLTINYAAATQDIHTENQNEANDRDMTGNITVSNSIFIMSYSTI